MKTNNYIRSLFIALIATFSVSLFVNAEDAKSGGLTGGYVVDDAVTVPANAYVTFSTLYGGKRYYLGVDTVRAKLGKDTIAVYDIPCYATMWVAGPLWSPDGKKMDNKDYSRWVKSVWLEENCKDTIKEGGIVKAATSSALFVSRRRFRNIWYIDFEGFVELCDVAHGEGLYGSKSIHAWLDVLSGNLLRYRD